ISGQYSPKGGEDKSNKATIGTPLKPQGTLITTVNPHNSMNTPPNTPYSMKPLQRSHTTVRPYNSMETPNRTENTMKPLLRAHTTVDTRSIQQSSGKPATSPWSAPGRLVSSLTLSQPWFTNIANTNQVGGGKGSASSTVWFVPPDFSQDTGSTSDTCLTDCTSPSGSPSRRRVKRKVLNRHLSMPPILR
ncbi:unnamed protein product, partial [Meganyctiphanes norvegica]